MPSNLLDNISWNFIKESAKPSVRSYILSVEEKLNSLIKPSISDSDRDRIAIAL